MDLLHGKVASCSPTLVKLDRILSAQNASHLETLLTFLLSNALFNKNISVLRLVGQHCTSVVPRRLSEGKYHQLLLHYAPCSSEL